MPIKKNKISSPKFLFSLITLFITACSTQPGVLNLKDAKAGIKNISAWIVYWDFDKGMQSLTTNRQIFDEINPFYYAFQEGGQITENPPPLKEKAQFPEIVASKRYKIIPTIVNDILGAGGKGKILKDPEIIHQILRDSRKRQQHIEEIVHLVENENYAGIDIDYEKLYFKDRELFTDFIKELASVLHAKNKILCVTVQPKTEEKSTDGAGAMDWSALAGYADKIQIMCYNFSWPTSKAGAIAPPYWVDEIITFAKGQIPKDKIVIAVALHGFDWSKGNAQSVSFTQAMETAARYKAEIKWDESTSTPYFTYRITGTQHEVWFENYKSIQGKLDVLKKQDLHSIALWRLGGEDSRIYSLF